jgi:hypothetical protein
LPAASGVIVGQIEEVLQGMGFQHFPQFKQLLGPGLLKLLHAPLAAFFAFNQVVTAEF